MQPDIVATIKAADQNQLLDLLSKAKVSVGHWNGRLMSVPGYSGTVTFSRALARVDSIYQGPLKPVHDRQKQYEKDTTCNVNVAPCRGRGSFLSNLVLLPFTCAAKLVGDVALAIVTPYPEVSKTEEYAINPTLDWRKQIDAQFTRLVKEGQDQVDDLATKSCRWKIARRWDAYLDTPRACKNVHGTDEQTLNRMVESRKQRIASQSGYLGRVAASLIEAFTAFINRCVAVIHKYLKLGN